MAFAIEAKAKGDEDKIGSAIRRLQEEDPTIDFHRDPQTGEQIIAGLSQVHVEVIVDRMKRRFGAEVNLKPPRVPYQETIKASAKAQGRYKKQTGGRGQFGDCHIEIEPLPHGGGFEFVNKIKGGVIPTGFIPAVEKGVVDAMRVGRRGGLPAARRARDPLRRLLPLGRLVRERVQGRRLDGLQEGRRAGAAHPARADHAGRRWSCPRTRSGDVIGDLNGRRGRPLGMEPKGVMTEIKAEVPMAEMLNYAPDLRSITGGRGEYSMEFARYEEVPAHLAQKVISASGQEEEAAAKA